ncbi:MAG: V-type ATPase subunit [Thermodesulfobacteriota bacterium]|nr:V-type ATPase subunit [Thermodesulfobacteriota bacterium]
MIFAAAGYAYPNAKVRALRSKRLTAQDHHFLLEAKDFSSFLAYLVTTTYGLALPNIEEEKTDPGALERRLARSLMEDYAKVARSLRGKREQELVLALFSRFESENLKVLLRAMFSGRGKQAVAHLLYPLGKLSALPWDDLWACSNPAEIADFLIRNPFGQALQHAIPQYNVQGRLFLLEMALDLSCFQRLKQAISGLRSRSDRKAAKRILGPYVDVLNILWVIRLKIHYKLSHEEIVNYSLPGGELLTLSHLHRLARAEDVSSFLEQMPRSLQKEVGEVCDWNNFHTYLETWLLRLIARLFMGPPFHIGIEIAFLMEKEMELTSLITLLEAKAQGLSPDKTVKKLPMQFFGVTYV